MKADASARSDTKQSGPWISLTRSNVEPRAFTIELRPNRPVTLVASTEEWASILALAPDEALAAGLARRQRLISAAPTSVQSAPASELVLAADQFIITPAGRIEDAARAKAAGDEVRTVIADTIGSPTGGATR